MVRVRLRACMAGMAASQRDNWSPPQRLSAKRAPSGARALLLLSRQDGPCEEDCCLLTMQPALCNLWQRHVDNVPCGETRASVAGVPTWGIRIELCLIPRGARARIGVPCPSQV